MYNKKTLYESIVVSWNGLTIPVMALLTISLEHVSLVDKTPLDVHRSAWCRLK